MRHLFIFAPLLHLGCKEPLVVKEYLALVSVSPGQGATQVAIDTDIIAGFSEPLVASTVDAQTAYLEDSTGLPVVASVTYDTNSHWIVIDPESDLLPDTQYTVTFTSEIEGQYAGLLLSPVQTRFTTSGESPSNGLPLSNAGADQSTTTGTTVTLDGTGSSDPEGAALFYTWRSVSAPAEASPELSDTAAASPTFVPDIQGEYVFGLTVSDGIQLSSEDFVAVQALGEASVDTGEPEETSDTGDDGSDDSSDDGSDDTGM
ncbi:MAG: hypothetical protein CL930_16700 [Deltaproteobacteria bacterium]|nr:hypothetical protein [Deltaproteobacteria bacterium]